jgi:flavin-dependent dehydrogenase
VKDNIGYILNRPEFIVELANNAKKRGVNIQTNDKINSITELNCDIIVDASGGCNQFKKELGLKRGPYGFGYQETLRHSNYFTSTTIKLYFTGENGYYWIFPRNPNYQEINLGVGFNNRDIKNLNELLAKFKEDYEITGEISNITAGIIPIGLQRPFKWKNILFVGDVGVGTFPLTGKGIYRALISGDIAGTCIAINQTKKYPYLINNAFVSREEVFSQCFLKLINVLRYINPNVVLRVLPLMFNTSNHISKYSKEV